MSKFQRDVFEKFHDYGCFIPQRAIYFGSEFCFDSDLGIESESTKRIIKNLLYLDQINKDLITIYLNFGAVALMIILGMIFSGGN